MSAPGNLEKSTNQEKETQKKAQQKLQEELEKKRSSSAARPLSPTSPSSLTTEHGEDDDAKLPPGYSGEAEEGEVEASEADTEVDETDEELQGEHSRKIVYFCPETRKIIRPVSLPTIF